MSLLPGQIIPASMPFGRLSPDGKSVLIDENWWLFLYNMYLNSVKADVASGFLKSFAGRTAPAVIPAQGDYSLAMLSDVDSQGWQNAFTLQYSEADHLWHAQPGGTVSSVAVEDANGITGTVANPYTQPKITLSTTVDGMVKGNGTALSAGVSGTDYSPGTSALGTGILKTTTGTGALSVAVAADFPTLNQNTTGNAATATLASTVTTNADLTGPVTSTGNATSITTNAITNTMLAQMDAYTLKGNNTGSPANAVDVSAADVTAMLDAYSGSVQGLVPAGSGGTTNYLREDGMWAEPSGGGAVSSVFGRTGAVVAEASDYSTVYGQLGAANVWTQGQVLQNNSNVGIDIISSGGTANITLANSATYTPTTPLLNIAMNYLNPTLMNALWWNGTNNFQSFGSTYNGGAPTFYTFKNTLDDGTGSATFANTISAIGASFVNGSSEADIHFGPEGSYLFSHSTIALGVYYPTTGVSLFFVDYSGNMTVAGHITGPTPTLSSITIDSGTIYQNTSGRWMNLYVGFSTISTGTVQTFLGPTSSPSLTRIDDVVGNRTITLRVPPGWYYEFSGLATSGSSYALYEN